MCDKMHSKVCNRCGAWYSASRTPQERIEITRYWHKQGELRTLNSARIAGKNSRNGLKLEGQNMKRPVCENCALKHKPDGCEGCLAGIAYDVAEERREAIEKGIRRYTSGPRR